MSNRFDQEYDLNVGLTTLEVDFSLPSGGWVRCRIRPLHEKYAISCTHIYDSFERFIQWLEAIASGASAATWLVQQEGSCSRIQFYGATRGFDDNTDFLVHIISDTAIDRVRGTAVERRQLVESFYSGFRALGDHSDYSPREWDLHPEWQQLEEMDDAEYTEAMQFRPYGGLPLQSLRSTLVEEYLAQGQQQESGGA